MDLKVVGKSEFMGKELPIIEGGFGDNQRVLTELQISKIHNMEIKEVRKSIKRLVENGRLKLNIDYIDIKSQVNSLPMNLELTFGVKTEYLSRTVNIFILSERGYSKLIKSMDDDESWNVMDNIIDEYFSMRKIINSDEELLSKLVLDIYNGGQNAVLSARQLTEIEVNKATKPLLEAIEVQKPLVNFADKLLKSKENILIGDFAKAIYTDGVNLGQNKLFSWLRDNDYLYKKGTDNFPYQKYIDNGLFVLKERIVDTVYNNKTIIKFTTLITPTGQLYFYNKLKKEFGDDK